MNQSGATATCDECGREVPRITRVLEGRRYCNTCYVREFKRRPCPRCGNHVRLPRRDTEAVCSKCENDKPCIRCGKTKYALGKITPYGPVCNACSVYFRERKPCDNCGKPSSRLMRSASSGDQRRLCSKCAQVELRSCQACGRHRQLRNMSDGRQLCCKCAELGYVACPACGEMMPAGYSIRRCEKCYWKALLAKRIAISNCAFSNPVMAKHFAKFSNWLSLRVGDNKAAITLNRYLPFFLEIEREWRNVPSYLNLMAHFGAEQLRRVRLPMTWLSETLGMSADASAREEDSERRRIEALMSSFPAGSLAGMALKTYRDMLEAKLAAGKTRRNSIRLALRPAVSLLLVADSSGRTLPDQARLDRYMQQTPGQMSALSGFVHHLNLTYQAALSMQRAHKRLRMTRKKKLEDELIEMIKHNEGDVFSSTEWISAALAYFHGLPRRRSYDYRDGDIVPSGEGANVLFRGKCYWIPHRSPEIEKWVT